MCCNAVSLTSSLLSLAVIRIFPKRQEQRCVKNKRPSNPGRVQDRPTAATIKNTTPSKIRRTRRHPTHQDNPRHSNAKGQPPQIKRAQAPRLYSKKERCPTTSTRRRASKSRSSSQKVKIKNEAHHPFLSTSFPSRRRGNPTEGARINQPNNQGCRARQKARGISTCRISMGANRYDV